MLNFEGTIKMTILYVINKEMSPSEINELIYLTEFHFEV